MPKSNTCNVVIVAALTMAVSTLAQSPATKRPIVLLVAKDQITASADAAGLAVPVGSAVVASGSKRTVLGVHSELPEVSRRFLEACPEVHLTLDANATPDYTIAVDVQHYPGLISIDLYQLMTLNGKREPVFVTKKNSLRRLVKPTCAFVMGDWKSSHASKADASQR